MSRFTKSHLIKGFLVLGFGLAVMAQAVDAKASLLSVRSSVERGNYVAVTAGSKWKSKPVVVEMGVKVKKTIKWSKVASTKTDKTGAANICSSKVLTAGNQLRLKSGKKILATIKISQPTALSGCGYTPPVPVAASVASTSSIPGAVWIPISTTSTTAVIASSTSTIPTTTIAPTTTTTIAPTTTTTIAPTTTTTIAPTTTTTTLPASTPAPTALALSVATDTGDSNTDGITKATNLVVVGSAQAGSSVQVYVGGISSGSPCTADGAGAFSCSLSTVPEGTKLITAKATGANGESIASSTLTIVVDRTAPSFAWADHITYIGSNVTISLSLTVSETTTTLSIADFNINCSMQGGCAISNFSGSGRNYSMDFRTINNTANGGTVFATTGSYADVAGNVTVWNPSTDFMYDMYGPNATFSRNGSLLTVVFDEAVLLVDDEDFRVDVYTNGSLHSSYPDGFCGRGVRNPSNDGQTWIFDLHCDVDSLGPPTTYEFVLSGVITDLEGNVAGFQSWLIPRISLSDA